MKLATLLLTTCLTFSTSTLPISKTTTPDNLQAPKSFMAYVIDVYDGDTCTVEICVWGEKKQAIFVREIIRFYGVDTDELRTKDLEEKQRGYTAKQFVVDRIANKVVRLEMVKRDLYGRYMANIFYTDADGKEVNLNDELISAGHAVAYFGGHRSVDNSKYVSMYDAYDRED